MTKCSIGSDWSSWGIFLNAFFEYLTLIDVPQ